MRYKLSVTRNYCYKVVISIGLEVVSDMFPKKLCVAVLVIM